MKNNEFQFQVKTFGCKVNTYDSGLLQKRLASKGFVESKDLLKNSNPKLGSEGTNPSAASSSHSVVPRIHILNTCAVTAEATKEAVREVRRIKSKDPFALVVVTGCAAQVDTDKFADLKAADLVVANSHKGDLENIIRSHYAGTLKERVFKSNIFKKEDLEVGGGEELSHTRSFLKIQDGCNSFCTFCVIPFARGKSRSIPVQDLVRKVQELESRGVREVVLTGVHIGDYEDEGRGSIISSDNSIGENTSAPSVECTSLDKMSSNSSSKNSLSEKAETLFATRKQRYSEGLVILLKEILRQTQDVRLRLSSLEPIELTEELIALYKDPRMCPHFHMSIQSANTKVLADMKRKYTAEDVESSLRMIAEKVPGAFVGMDVIAGFPGETQDEFADTYERLANLPWTRLHVFPYSHRPGTVASRRDDMCSDNELRARAERLRQLSADRYNSEALKQIGTVKKVLGLKKGNADDNRTAFGLSHDYWNVQLDMSSLVVGKEAEVQITGFNSTVMKLDPPLMGQCLK